MLAILALTVALLAAATLGYRTGARAERRAIAAAARAVRAGKSE